MDAEKVFRVWLFDRNENSTTNYNYDGYGDTEYEVNYNIQGAECVEVTEQELVDLRVGLQRNSHYSRKALLVRDLRKEAAGEYALNVSSLIRNGEAAREHQRLEKVRKDRQAEVRKKKSQQEQTEKKRKQLEKLQKELAALES